MVRGSIDAVVTRLKSMYHPGAWTLARVDWDSLNSRTQAIDRLRETFAAESVPFAEIDLPEGQPLPQTIDFLLAELGRHSSGVVSITGLESAYPKDGRLLDIMVALNFQRERLASFPLLQIWWMPSQITDLFVTGVPDLNSWFQLPLHLTEISPDQPVRTAVPSSHKVFISSTAEDLQKYRAAARDAAISASLLPVMMEYFAASGEHPPLMACLRKVSDTGVLVAIVAHRYGWVPEDQPGGGHKSITWLECEQAQKEGKEILAFVIDKSYDWPAAAREVHRFEEAILDGRATPELLTEVQANVQSLKDFKRWLDGLGIRAAFTTPDDLKAKIIAALHEWRTRHSATPEPPPPKPNDVSVYFQYLRDLTGWIDIRGLQVGAGKAYRFPIDDLYIPLTDQQGARLEDALASQRLVIVGDPGAGKTTFLRRIVHALASGGEHTKMLPIFIRVADLAPHLTSDNPESLIRYLETQNESLNWGLSVDFFRARLKAGECTILLDGLDEAANRTQRERIGALFEKATQAYRRCRFIVTTRPQSYIGESVLAGFEQAKIEPVDENSIHIFLEHWCRALFPETPSQAARHLADLSGALAAKPEIKQLASNPMMLTALAVVHWNEHRLPQQRAELYGSILTWLARSREKRPGQEPADRSLTLLSRLALGMQTDERGRQTQIEKWQAAQLLDIPQAQAFIEQEEIDSGIIVSRGPNVQFWHLTFQEYLAARAIAGLPDAEQYALLLERDRFLRPEWRETILLLAGILIRQGYGKVDALFHAILDRLPTEWNGKARVGDLLAAIIWDLAPLQYKPADPRYLRLKDELSSFLDPETAKGFLDLSLFHIALSAGDPQLRSPLAAQYWYRVQFTPNHFQLGQLPVNVAEYRRFVDSGGYNQEQWWTSGGFGAYSEPENWSEQLKAPNRPLNSVSWYEAAAYCSWASARLPTIAEMRYLVWGEGATIFQGSSGAFHGKFANLTEWTADGDHPPPSAPRSPRYGFRCARDIP